MEHLIHLKGYRASHDEGGILKLGTKDSFGIETLKIDADEAWDGLIISATFVTSVGRTKMVMKSDNTIEVPPEATASDTRSTINRIVFSGIKTQMQRITTDLPYEIDPHAPIDGDNSTPRTPDEYIQFVEEMKEEVRNANPVPDPTEEDDGKVPVARDGAFVLEIPQGGGSDFDINTATPAFTEAEARENIQTGETIPTLFGKIKKFFTDLKTVAFTGQYSDLTGQPQALKNPNALTFTGGATGTYDGSSPLEIAIPSGGGSGGGINPTLLATLNGDGESIELTADVDLTDGLYAFGGGIPENTPDDNKGQSIYAQIGDTGIFGKGIRTAAMPSNAAIGNQNEVTTIYVKNNAMYICGAFSASNSAIRQMFYRPDGVPIVKQKISLYSQTSKPVPVGAYAMLWRLG